MIKDKKTLKEYIDADLSVAYVPHNPIKRWLHWIHGNEQCATYDFIHTLRMSEYYMNTHSLLLFHLYRWRLSRLGLRLGLRVNLNCVGKGLNIIHICGGGGAIINAMSMGEYCIVQSGVVIGNKGDGEHKPTIGNNVEFCIGCKVYGKITIGDNVTILPNAVVDKDVPANAIVGGVPAKIIKFKNIQ